MQARVMPRGDPGRDPGGARFSSAQVIVRTTASLAPGSRDPATLAAVEAIAAATLPADDALVGEACTCDSAKVHSTVRLAAKGAITTGMAHP